MTKGGMTNSNKPIWQLPAPSGGISDTKKFGTPNSVAFLSNFDVRTDPTQTTLNPAPSRVGSGIITDLVMWFDLACTNLYGYGNTGNIYKKNSSDVWSLDHVAPDSQGNGLVYFPEDGYLYYAQNITLGRQIDACTGGTYYDGFLESEGGEPTNAQSITLVRASSQYASIADNPQLSITNDITLEAYVKLASLPTTSQVFTIASKWNENSNQRSYKFDITTSSNFFGNGQDGLITISSNTTQAPIDSACSGVLGTSSLSATNVSFASGQKILIVQEQGTNATLAQLTSISSYTAGTIITQDPLGIDFSSTGNNKAQVIVVPQYTNITINTGITWSAKIWNGATGGRLVGVANGTITRTGSVSASGKGFNLDGQGGNINGTQGEGTAGRGVAGNNAANGNGAGAGIDFQNASGAGGGNAATGASGQGGIRAGIGGNAVGAADLSSSALGGQGGGSGSGGGTAALGGAGGPGGGAIFLAGVSWSGTGPIVSAGTDGTINDDMGGGGGSGGSIALYTQTGIDMTNVSAAGGLGGVASKSGGNGSVGRIAVYYATAPTGSSSPAYTGVNDPTLSNVDGYILRLLLSSNGTNSEIYSTDITNLISSSGTLISQWKRFQVKWQASTSTANFFANASPLGTSIRTFTSIFDSTARFAIGTAYDSAGTAHDFLNGKVDDFRLWNDLRTDSELVTYNDQVMVGVEQGFIAYYKFEGNVNDSQTVVAANNLTATGSPTYSSDVPFSGVTTRADQDILINASGDTYALKAALSELAVDRQSFVPTKEPLKSLSLNIDTVGTGNWTVVVHDGLNRVQNSITVPNAALHTGIYEFIFASSDRPILGATYHVHVYSTVADGKIVSSTHNDMEGTTVNTGAYLATYFQILVSDQYHPMVQFLNFIAIGNERYVATLEAGSTYNPHRIILPAGYRVRSLAFWGEYLAIGTWKGNAITDTDSGKIFFWNGTDDTFAEGLDVPEGGINSMYGSQGTLSLVAGYEGKFIQYTGGPKAYKITQIPLQETSDYTEIAPGSMTMWRSLVRLGGTINTNSTTIHQGIYSYGKLNENVPTSSLGFDTLSIGDQMSNSVKVGGLFPAGRKLYAGWQNGNIFGVDEFDPDSLPYTTGRIESMILDLGKIMNDKLPLVYRVDCDYLLSGQSITLEYQVDRSGTWKTLITQSSVGTKNVRGIINERAKEIQLAVSVTTTSTTPVILNQALENDPYDPVV